MHECFLFAIFIRSIGRGFSLCGAVTGFSLARGRRALPEITVRNLDRRSAGIGVPVRRRSNGDALARYYVNRKTQLYEKTALHVDGSRRLRGVRSEGAARFFDFRYRHGSRLRRRRRAGRAARAGRFGRGAYPRYGFVEQARDDRTLHRCDQYLFRPGENSVGGAQGRGRQSGYVAQGPGGPPSCRPGFRIAREAPRRPRMRWRYTAVRWPASPIRAWSS